MGILNLLGSIPTASNLALKLKDAEAQNAILKSENAVLKTENAKLKSDFEQANKQIVTLTERITQLESSKKTNRPRFAITDGDPTGSGGPQGWMR